MFAYRVIWDRHSEDSRFGPSLAKSSAVYWFHYRSTRTKIRDDILSSPSLEVKTYRLIQVAVDLVYNDAHLLSFELIFFLPWLWTDYKPMALAVCLGLSSSSATTWSDIIDNV